MYELDQYTVSLLHFEDGLKDETGKVWTSQNGAGVSRAKSKFGKSSLYLDGVNQYLSLPYDAAFDFKDGDFTVDFYINFPSIQENKILGLTCMGNLAKLRSPSDIQWGIYKDTGIMVSEVCSGNTQYFGKSTITPSLNTWYHIAIVKSGTTLLYFINGVLTSTTPCSAALNSSTSFGIVIGADKWLGSYTNCYIDEYRISNIARWNSDFTPPTAPDDIGINPPTNLTATAGDSQTILLWSVVTGAVGYNVKRSTTAGGPYTTIATNVTGTSYVDNTVANGTTYYYVVTAVDGKGNESTNSNEASATPQAPSGHGLLRITMNDSSEREYQLSHDEINKFIEWCDRTVGTGKTLYVFDKTYNVGEFKSRKEYLLFEKIISFEVMELTK
jgi:hypothetical protein